MTGTPGSGKTTISKKLSSELGFKYFNVSEVAVEHEFVDSYDEAMDSLNLDEDKLLDYLEVFISFPEFLLNNSHLQPKLGSHEGGVIVDYHSCEMFPERWFDGVFVLRCDNTTLFDRLTTRGYKENKIQENLECEIFGAILEEARESYPEEIVYELENINPDQINQNISQIVEWAKRLIKN